ncbi:MAG: phosphomannomutase/phosphoglucomutase [Candidatus Heimdallarchaeota archaeon]|nr:MAG: phosphomannomutase/phosphoglucomutase [Candidatus Heimdallarchaeota archaeon]
MKIYKNLFRTYDIRGKFPDQFSSEMVLNIGRALGTFFGLEKTIVIGGDVRLSSPIIRSVISAGLMEAGCNILDVGVCTTPTIYFLAVKNPEIDGGVMITASHNPIDYNGIKVCDGKGVSYHTDNLFTRIKEMIEQNAIVTVKNTEYGQPALLQNINTSQYWQFQKDQFIPKTSLNIAVEIGNGTCYPIIELLKSKKMNVQAFHSEPNGHFPIMIPDPAKPASLKFVQEAVIKNELDIGIGFDADGDRVGFVDDQGAIISPDQVIMLYGNQLLQRYPNAEIMVDVKTSRATFEYLSGCGAQVKFTRVGHSWIHEALLKSGAIFAGELSGHYYFGADYYGFDDAIYSALRMLEIVSNQEQTLSKLVQNLPQYPASEELRISCSEEIKSEVVSNLKDLLKEEALESITIDGIRAEYEDGWVLVRKSGTESVLSVRAEATTSQRLKYYKEYVKKLVFDEIEKVTKKTKKFI